MVLKEELLVPFEDTVVEIEPVVVRETVIDRDPVDEPEPVRVVVVVDVAVLVVVCVLDASMDPVIVADVLDDLLVEILRVAVRVVDIVEVAVEELD